MINKTGIVKDADGSKFAEIISNGKVCVIFSASWCGPCKSLKLKLDDVAAEVKDVAFYIFDVDQNTELASKLSVRSIPTVLFYANGVLCNKHLGDFSTPKAMMDWFKDTRTNG